MGGVGCQKGSGIKNQLGLGGSVSEVLVFFLKQGSGLRLKGIWKEREDPGEWGNRKVDGTGAAGIC